MPDADIAFTGKPFVVLGAEANHRAALCADEILAGDADGPAEPRGHADDLIGGVDRIRPPDFRDRLHLRGMREQLHACYRRLQPQQAVEVGDEASEIDLVSGLLLHGILPTRIV